MPTLDLEKIAEDLVAKAAGTGIAAAGTAMHVPAPIAAMIATYGAAEAAKAAHWILAHGEAAIRAQLLPDQVQVQTGAIEWADDRDPK